MALPSRFAVSFAARGTSAEGGSPVPAGWAVAARAAPGTEPTTSTSSAPANARFTTPILTWVRLDPPQLSGHHGIAVRRRERVRWQVVLASALFAVVLP